MRAFVVRVCALALEVCSKQIDEHVQVESSYTSTFPHYSLSDCLCNGIFSASPDSSGELSAKSFA